MQGYLYSTFSSAALVIHLIINFNLLIGRGVVTAHGARYRGFVLGVKKPPQKAAAGKPWVQREVRYWLSSAKSSSVNRSCWSA